MKVCYRCKINKPLTDYNKNSYYSDGLSHSCRQCISETTYRPKKEYYSAYSSNKAKNNRRIFQEYKATLKCTNCDESRHWVLDFHHTGDDKEYSVANLVREGYSFNRVKKEIDKCIPLCRNCHADLHYQQRQQTM